MRVITPALVQMKSSTQRRLLPPAWSPWFPVKVYVLWSWAEIFLKIPYNLGKMRAYLMDRVDASDWTWSESPCPDNTNVEWALGLLDTCVSSSPITHHLCSGHWSQVHNGETTDEKMQMVTNDLTQGSQRPPSGKYPGVLCIHEEFFRSDHAWLLEFRYGSYHFQDNFCNSARP